MACHLHRFQFVVDLYSWYSIPETVDRASAKYGAERRVGFEQRWIWNRIILDLEIRTYTKAAGSANMANRNWLEGLKDIRECFQFQNNSFSAPNTRSSD